MASPIAVPSVYSELWSDISTPMSPPRDSTPAFGKPKETFRVYGTDGPREDKVNRHYRLMRTHQTYEFVERMEEKYLKFDKAEMTVWEAFEKLNDFVDASDPDTDNPNLEHMLQTAEAIRAAGHPEWFQLVGLLHDMGKLMFLWGDRETGQEHGGDGHHWALSGDTWVVGCRIPDGSVLPHLNTLNPDMHNPKYNTPLGIYTPGCGLKNVKFAWGHDEYMYRMLLHNNARLPSVGLDMVRLHSCYPWHRQGEYRDLMDADDHESLKWVLEFNKFDLYSKADERPDVEALKPYYQGLIDKFLPGVLHW
jgi:inositol oxygenase